MRKIVILFLMLSVMLFAGCAAQIPPENIDPSEKLEQEALFGEDRSEQETQPTPSAGSEEDGADQSDEEITKMYVTIGSNKLEITLAENSSVEALVELLKEGDITFPATENGGFEIYGDIGHTLPANNTQLTAEAGDVLLYAGSNLCFFFGSNSYSYTRIGRINGYTMSELKALLGAGQGKIQVTISLK